VLGNQYNCAAKYAFIALQCSSEQQFAILNTKQVVLSCLSTSIATQSFIVTPTSTKETAAVDNTFTSGCQSTKGCFRSPPGCLPGSPSCMFCSWKHVRSALCFLVNNDQKQVFDLQIQLRRVIFTGLTTNIGLGKHFNLYVLSNILWQSNSILNQ